MAKEILLINERKIRLDGSWVQPDQAAARILTLSKMPDSRGLEETIHQIKVQHLPFIAAEQATGARSSPDFVSSNFHPGIIIIRRGIGLANRGGTGWEKVKTAQVILRCFADFNDQRRLVDAPESDGVGA